MKALLALLLALAPLQAAEFKSAPIPMGADLSAPQAMAPRLPELSAIGGNARQAALGLPLAAAAAVSASAPAAISATPIPSYAAPTPTGVPAARAWEAGEKHRPSAGSFAAVSERVRAEVGRNWTSAFESLVESHDVVLLGESHRSLSSYAFVAQQLPRLKAAGATTVGLEGLKAPHQDAVDRWLSEKSGAPPPLEAVSFSPARSAEVAALFRAAKEHGVRLVALGLPLSDWAAQVSRLASERSSDLDETVPKDLPDQLAAAERTYRPGYNEAFSEVVLGRRNEAMAARLADALPPGGKAVAILGDAHLDHHDALSYRLFWLPLEAYGSVARQLRARLVSAISVTLTGGRFVNPREDAADHRRIHAAAYQLLDAANPDGQVALYRTSEGTALLHLGR